MAPEAFLTQRIQKTLQGANDQTEEVRGLAVEGLGTRVRRHEVRKGPGPALVRSDTATESTT